MLSGVICVKGEFIFKLWELCNIRVCTSACSNFTIQNKNNINIYNGLDIISIPYIRKCYLHISVYYNEC